MRPDLSGLLPDTPTTRGGYPTGCIIDLDEADRIQAALDADPNTGPADFVVAGADIVGTGEGKTVLHYEAMRKVVGHDIIRRQRIGDCVSQGSALAVDLLTCIQVLAGENIRWVAETATEVIYAGSRNEVGGGRLSGDGSQGSWAARFLTEWGAVPRGVYGDVDLSEYDPARARAWGAPGRGVPDGLEAVVRKYPVKSAVRLRSYEDVRDACANWHPCFFASPRGFTTTRDAEGFCRASGTWQHLMGCGGIHDDPRRPGGVVWQSWGANMPRGPLGPLNLPNCCFLADAEVLDWMCKRGDCWAISGYRGLPRREIDLGGLLPQP